MKENDEVGKWKTAKSQDRYKISIFPEKSSTYHLV